MVLDGLVWKTSPGACEVEPPASKSGPWSTTTTSLHPSPVRCSAALQPTMPAPMITTLALSSTLGPPSAPPSPRVVEKNRPRPSPFEVLGGDFVAYCAPFSYIRH